VSNQLLFAIQLQPLSEATGQHAIGKSVCVEPNTTRSIISAGESLCFMLVTERSSSFVVLNFKKQCHQTMLLKKPDGHLFIEYLLEDSGIHRILTLKKPELPQPLMIANRFDDIEIAYSQFHWCTQVPVPANSTGIVGLEEPSSLTTLTIYFENVLIDVDWKQEKCVEVEKRTVFVCVITTNVQTVIVSPTPIKHVIPRQFYLKISIPNINVSLFERMRREFLLFSMHHISSRYFTNEFLSTVNLFVHSIQIDDMHPLADNRVSLIGSPQKNFHFLEFRSSFRQVGLSTNFEIIRVRIQKVLMLFEIHFLSDLLNFLIPKSFEKTVNPPDTSSSVWSRIPVSAERLIVHHTSFSISTRTSRRRPKSSPWFMEKMRIVPDISNFALHIPKNESCLDDISISALEHAILEPYEKAIKDQFWRVIGSLDLLSFKRQTLTEIAVSRGKDWLKGEQPLSGLTYVMPEPLRIARAMPDNRICPFRQDLALLQLNCQLADQQLKYADEILIMIIEHHGNEGLVCVTQKFIFLFHGDQAREQIGVAPQAVIDLTRVHDVSHQVIDVQVDAHRPPISIQIHCNDYFEAERLSTYLKSRRFALLVK
jgi:hypothetical protein